MIRPRPWGDNPELELKINEISLLEDIFDKRTKSILLNIPIQNISNELCENLQKIAKKHCRIRLKQELFLFS